MYETGGRALTDDPSKPGGTCVRVRVCAQKFVFSAGALAVSMHMWLGVMKCVGVQYECVCVFVFPVRAGDESKQWGWVVVVVGGARSSASPSCSAPGTRAATCLRGFQYPVCVHDRVCVCVFVFTQGMQFIIFVCVSGLLQIHSSHMRTEADRARRLEQDFILLKKITHTQQAQDVMPSLDSQF